MQQELVILKKQYTSQPRAIHKEYRVILYDPRVIYWDRRMILYELREILYTTPGWSSAIPGWAYATQVLSLHMTPGQAYHCELLDYRILDQIIFELSDYRNIEIVTLN